MIGALGITLYNKINTILTMVEQKYFARPITSSSLLRGITTCRHLGRFPDSVIQRSLLFTYYRYHLKVFEGLLLVLFFFSAKIQNTVYYLKYGCS